MDPLFKKASADFDEGGAKGLLLNHLAIDHQGRIVFDSSDEVEAAAHEKDDTRRKDGAEAEDINLSFEENDQFIVHGAGVKVNISDGDVDLSGLRARFFSDLDRLDVQDVCPSLKDFDLGDSMGTLDIPFLKPPEVTQSEKNDKTRNIGDQSGIFIDDANLAGFDEDDRPLDGLVDMGFGEGGEYWAGNVASQPFMHSCRSTSEDDHELIHAAEDTFGAGELVRDQYAVRLQHGRYEDSHENILSYFDNTLRRDWAGPEHWKIRRMKHITNLSMFAPTKRKEKEPYAVEFVATLDPGLADIIYTPAVSNTAICLPKTQWKSKTRNLLPDDKHFSSKQLTSLFLKPKARVGGINCAHSTKRQHVRRLMGNEPREKVDKEFWALQDSGADQDAQEQGRYQGAYDANFFQDDGLAFPGGSPDEEDEDEVDNFADAREVFSPAMEAPGFGDARHELYGTLQTAAGSQEGAFGTQLVTQNRRLRPEYVQYARVAKKVDVRRLKEEMWKGIGFDVVLQALLHYYDLC